MNFELTDDQQQIKRTAHELLASRATPEKVRAAAEAGAYDGALWRELAELGWPGIAVAEEHGGQGLGFVELAVLLEEIGYALAPSPFLGTVLAATAIEHAGSSAQKERWLPALASGEATGAFATSELIPDAPDAAVIVIAEPDGSAATLIEGGSAEAVDSIDPPRRFGRLRDAGGEPLEGDVAGAVDRAAVAVGAELVGVCQRALDMTLGYVKERRQFGVPVGSFQAVQHMAAQMLRDTEAARSLAYFGAWTADASPGQLPMAAAMAAAHGADAGRSVTGSAIQLHGGIGFTWEADVHWLYKRAQLDAHLLGGAGRHRARVTKLAAEARTATV
jgi:alkylation response protein AidB-like acyl-CoA dehydrogenase